MTDIEQQARKESRSFYRSSCGRIVQRVPGQDEFGDPQVTEHYMPVEAAIAMHEELGTALLSERSKPSLMVGFSEKDWRNTRITDLRISVRLCCRIRHHDTIGGLLEHIGVVVSSNHDTTYYRIRNALKKREGIGEVSAIEGASAILDEMKRSALANTRAVSIDKIMDEVMGWCCATKDAEEDLRERLMKIMP